MRCRFRWAPWVKRFISIHTYMFPYIPPLCSGMVPFFLEADVHSCRAALPRKRSLRAVQANVHRGFQCSKPAGARLSFSDSLVKKCGAWCSTPCLATPCCPMFCALCGRSMYWRSTPLHLHLHSPDAMWHHHVVAPSMELQKRRARCPLVSTNHSNAVHHC